MKTRTTLRLPDELLKRAKRTAAAEGYTLTSVIEEGLRLMLAGKRKSAKQARALPRVSTATGGLMPGIDLTSHAALQEIDDLEWVERMKRLE